MFEYFIKRLSDKVASLLNERLIYNYTIKNQKLRNSKFGKNAHYWLNHNIELLHYDESDNFIFLKKDNLYFLTTPDYSHIIKEVFCWNIYFINPKFLKRKEYIVFDMGMNRGYATLYFANQPWCKKVYGFELSENTFQIAKKNIDMNVTIGDKIQIFNYGLGDKDEKLKMYYLPHRDGICTTSKEFLASYAPEEMEYIVETEGTIKRSATVVKEILEQCGTVGIVLKIDVESAEYAIMGNIANEYPAFFDNVDVIIGEAHLGLDPLINQLKPFGFREVPTKTFNKKTNDFLFVKN